MRFLALAPLFAASLLLTIPAGAQTVPIFPDTGGEMCCCPTVWIVDKGGKPFCQVPPGVGLIALPEAEDKARTERMQAIDAVTNGAHPYSGHGH